MTKQINIGFQENNSRAFNISSLFKIKSKSWHLIFLKCSKKQKISQDLIMLWDIR